MKLLDGEVADVWYMRDGAKSQFLLQHTQTLTGSKDSNVMWLDLIARLKADGFFTRWHTLMMMRMKIK